MRGYADAGDRSAALRQFERLNTALAQVGLQPEAETLALHEEISRGPAAVAGREQAGRQNEARTARFPHVHRRSVAGLEARGGCVSSFAITSPPHRRLLLGREDRASADRAREVVPSVVDFWVTAVLG